MIKLIVLPTGDFILSIFALYCSLFLRFGSIPGTEMFNLTGIKLIVFGFVLVFLSFMLEMYSQEKDGGKKELLVKVFGGVSIGLVVLSALYYLSPIIILGRGVLVFSLITFGLFQFLWHLSYRVFRFSGLARKVLILGSGPLAQTIAEIVKESESPVCACRIHQYAE